MNFRIRIKNIGLSLGGLFVLASLQMTAQEKQSDFPVHYLATWQLEKMAVREPTAIDVDPSGFVYIVDAGNNRIVKLDDSGVLVTTVGGYGWGSEQFDDPSGLCASNGLDVFVADLNNQRIERYDKDLHYLSTYVSDESAADYLTFGFPLDVTISPQGELFLLDGENLRVLKLDVLGEPKISFGGFDSGDGRLIRPDKILVRRDRLYVTDAGASQSMIYDIHGNFLYGFGHDQLDEPAGLACTADGFLVVADKGHHALFVFEETGNYVGRIDSRFREPVDAACRRDRLYVLDRGRCAVDIFRWPDYPESGTR